MSIATQPSLWRVFVLCDIHTRLDSSPPNTHIKQSRPLSTSITRHLSRTHPTPIPSQLNGLSSRRSSPVDTLSSVTWIARTTAPSSEHQHQQPPYPTHHYRPRRLLDKTTLSTNASHEEQELAAIQPSLVESSLAKIKPKQQ